MKLGNQKGMTMVEVIVAFTVLVLIMGIFSQAMVLTGRMMGKANDTLVSDRQLEGEYYLGKDGTAEKNVSLSFEPAQGNNESGFSVPAKFRTYSGTYGKIYDVIPETTEESEK